jgi:hypothetical protein
MSPVDATSILPPRPQALPERRRRLSCCIGVVLSSCRAVFTVSFFSDERTLREPSPLTDVYRTHLITISA